MCADNNILVPNKQKVKVKVTLCLVKHHPHEGIQGREITGPRILKFDATWK
jgi:hypothetical protein